jgi:hypothetical protein
MRRVGNLDWVLRKSNDFELECTLEGIASGV